MNEKKIVLLLLIPMISISYLNQDKKLHGSCTISFDTTDHVEGPFLY